MKKELTVKNKITRADFEFSEFIQWCKDNTGKTLCSSKSSESTSDNEWAGSKSLSEALTIAETGWKKGTDLISETLEHIKAKGIEVTHQPKYDVAGESVEMGLFLSGEPECMLDWEETIKEGFKEVDIYFNVIASAGYSPEQLINYGSVALSVVDYLESTGVRVNLYSYYSIRPNKRDSIIAVKIKDAKESLNIPICAFALCHPSMMRRLMFKGVECLEGFHDFGYGPIAEFEPNRFSDNENVIRFQTINNTGCRFESKEATKKYLEKKLPELLNELNIKTEIEYNQDRYDAKF